MDKAKAAHEETRIPWTIRTDLFQGVISLFSGAIEGESAIWVQSEAELRALYEELKGAGGLLGWKMGD